MVKDNQKLLDYVNIPGYNLEYANRDNKRGVGLEFISKKHLPTQNANTS